MGTGTYEQNNPTVITCGFKPKMVYICLLYTSLGEAEVNSANVILLSSYNSESMLFMDTLTSPFPAYTQRSGTRVLQYDIYFSFTDNGISFYANDAQLQFNNNINRRKYYYIAFG